MLGAVINLRILSTVWNTSSQQIPKFTSEACTFVRWRGIIIWNGDIMYRTLQHHQQYTPTPSTVHSNTINSRFHECTNCFLWLLSPPRLSRPQPGQDIDPQFRLWLSSKPDPSFPVSILQKGLKVCYFKVLTYKRDRTFLLQIKGLIDLYLA